jgi:hypothetical protein
MNKIKKVVLVEVIFDRHKVVEAEVRIFALRANGEGSLCITGKKTAKTLVFFFNKRTLKDY